MARRPTTSRSRAPSPSRRSTSSRRTARARGRRLDARVQRRGRQAHRPRAPRRDHRRAREGQALDGVEQVADPFAEGGTISQDGRLASVDVRYDLEPDELEKADGEALIEAAETAEQGGVEVAARGILIDLASEQEAPVGELIGVGIAIILLTLLFRSLAAMAATLIGALIGVMVGQILLAALAKPLGLPQFAA